MLLSQKLENFLILGLTKQMKKIYSSQLSFNHNVHILASSMPTSETCCQCQPFFDSLYHLLLLELNWKMCQLGIVEKLKSSVSGIISFNGCCCSCRENAFKASTCSLLVAQVGSGYRFFKSALATREPTPHCG